MNQKCSTSYPFRVPAATNRCSVCARIISLLSSQKVSHATLLPLLPPNITFKVNLGELFTHYGVNVTFCCCCPMNWRIFFLLLAHQNYIKRCTGKCSEKKRAKNIRSIKWRKKCVVHITDDPIDRFYELQYFQCVSWKLFTSIFWKPFFF